ncbi:MAG: hypothetical protein LC800_19260 [Acidobacteria bacterium]|nr:hypothetical protein [Acidobacteriota bacterium]
MSRWPRRVLKSFTAHCSPLTPYTIPSAGAHGSATAQKKDERKDPPPKTEKVVPKGEKQPKSDERRNDDRRRGNDNRKKGDG